MNALGLHVNRRLLVTLRLGELPEHLPAWRATTQYGVPFAEKIDGGIIDRLVKDYGGAMRCARMHSGSRPRSSSLVGVRRFDDVEQLTGVARVVRIELAQGQEIHELVTALQQVPSVDSALVEHLSFAPLDHSAIDPRTPASNANLAPSYNLAEAWASRELIRMPQALGYCQGDPAVIVGLVDSGVMAQHQALPDGGMRRGFDTVDLSPSMVGGLQLVGDNLRKDEDPSDDVGHGTGCAGILRADGLELPPGAAGRCSVLPVRVLAAAMSGQRRVGVGSIANIDAGMKRLIDLGVKVINMSFGTAESQLVAGGALPHLEVVRYALARGVILVAASGNSGLSERYFPAAHDGVIAVGSVNSQGQPSRFSTRGSHVTLCAPGEGIWTCGLGEGGTSLQRASGTSFAAPFVTATCALLAARADARAWPLNASDARSLLVNSCAAHRSTDITDCGAGVLDAWAALRALDSTIDADDADFEISQALSVDVLRAPVPHIAAPYPPSRGTGLPTKDAPW
jgi:subtilisin family serine protease